MIRQLEKKVVISNTDIPKKIAMYLILTVSRYGVFFYPSVFVKDKVY